MKILDEPWLNINRELYPVMQFPILINRVICVDSAHLSNFASLISPPHGGG